MAIPNSKLKDVAFSSNYRYERVILRGHQDYYIGTDPFYNYTTISIPHNLGYVPFYKIWVRLPANSRLYQLEVGSATYGLVGAYQIEDSSATTTTINIGISCSASSGSTGTVYYRIYEEPQNA